MELRQIRQFLAIVDEGSFTAAAQALGISQQAVSKAMAALEDEFGVRLFDRDTRLVVLSHFGEMLLAHARNIDAEAQQFTRQMNDAIGVRSGRLTIGAGQTAATHILPEVIGRLLKRRPNLRISVRDGSAAMLIPMLLRGELDATLCVLGQPLDDSLIREEVLFHERLQVMIGANHPLADAGRVDLAALLNHAWFVGWSPRGIDPIIASCFTQQGLKPPVPRLDTSSLPLARALLLTGEYLAVLPEHLFTAELAAGTITVVDVEVEQTGWSRPMTLCYRRNSTRSPATMAMVGELNTLMRQATKITGLVAA